MDPVSQHQVWKVISEAKKGRVVILTTHSMEEADTLSDRIGIGIYFFVLFYFLFHFTSLIYFN